MREKISAKIVSILTAALVCGIGLTACSDDGANHAAAIPEEKAPEFVPVPIDYSKGRAMNARLGKGINLGNAWESACYYGSNIPDEPYNFGGTDNLDACWGNAIEDSYFAFVKAAGFNSVRIPVRWQHNSNPVTHEVSPERLAGVHEDVKLATAAGLAVVISFHWYYEIMEAANNADANPVAYENEKIHFASIWSQVATAFEDIPDSLLVWDILNEPTIKSADRLNEVMTLGYNAIRTAAPGKTIMFESYHAAKFADITALKLPQDGNIIFSGHYYEPYNYTHQGHSYDCLGDVSYLNTAKADIRGYVATVQRLYPDINGGHVPMNMGEFGVSGGESATTSSCDKGNELPSPKMKAEWAKETIKAAEMYDISWHYWGFVGVGGFEAFDRQNEVWYDGFPAAFGL